MKIRLINTVLIKQFVAAILFSIVCSLILVSCAGKNGSSTITTQDGPPSEYVDVSKIPDAVPQKTTLSRYGNPDNYEVFGKRYYVLPSSKNYKEKGIASWYGSKFHGRRTSSGEPYDMHAMTAAHKTLPLPTYVKVTNLKNNRQVILKVNDRGPFHDNRIIDLSHTAAVKLGVKASGTGLVEVEAITPGEKVSIKPKAADRTKEIGLYIQLGAFSDSQNAYSLMQRSNLLLSSKQTHINKVQRNNQALYHVRIGPFNNIARADELTKTLTEKGLLEHHFVIE